MPINRASFGLVTQLLDLIPDPVSSSSLVPQPSFVTAWAPVLGRVRALGAGAMAEEVARGTDATVTRFLELQQEAQPRGLETFLRLRELTDEALGLLREIAAVAAAQLAPGETGPPGLRLMVDLGEPDEADLARWLPRRIEEVAAPRGSGPEIDDPEELEDGPAGSWSQALAFSVFGPDGETTLRRLERVAVPLLEVAGRPGVEQPVWLAAFGVGGRGAAADPDGVIQVAVHALALGIERLFLAPGPDDGWRPTDLDTPPPPLQAFRTLAGRLNGATRVTRIAAGQYRIELADHPPRYLLWSSPDVSRLPADLQGPLELTTTLGVTGRADAAALKLTPEPIFIERVG